MLLVYADLQASRNANFLTNTFLSLSCRVRAKRAAPLGVAFECHQGSSLLGQGCTSALWYGEAEVRSWLEGLRLGAYWPNFKQAR